MATFYIVKLSKYKTYNNKENLFRDIDITLSSDNSWQKPIFLFIYFMINTYHDLIQYKGFFLWPAWR